MRFRKLIFWLHLSAGLIAGVVILVMCITGAVLAFEKEIVTWAERAARRVTPAADATRLPLDDLLARVQEKKPGERPSGITLHAGPTTALMVSFGRTNTFYVNPYTGEVRVPDRQNARAFMQAMTEWHRYLGGHDERRATGKAVTGACNTAFLFLATSGLFLWWPRQWTKSALRSVSLMSFKLRGKARDWNWHNVLGLWCAPVLIVLTATAMPISYRWAGDLIYKLTGTAPPPQAGSGVNSPPAVEIPTPATGAKPLSMDELFAAAQRELPRWRQITSRSSGAGGRGERGGSNRTFQPIILFVTEKGAWPFFATVQLTLDPFTGAILRKEAFSDFNLGRKVRSWTRFLHTGEALGTAGKAVAGLASAGAVLLVWTGFALAWRRFFNRQTDVEAAETPISGESAPQAAVKE